MVKNLLNFTYLGQCNQNIKTREIIQVCILSMYIPLPDTTQLTTV